jgi:hypothetical protein
MGTAEQIGAKILATLAAQNASKREAGMALRAEIRAVMVAHPGAPQLTAKRVLALLTRKPSPSVRRIQEHMQAINAEPSVPRF